jgi:hypothetical protein
MLDGWVVGAREKAVEQGMLVQVLKDLGPGRIVQQLPPPPRSS